ncbi:MAG: prepilin-type N-terminal cleavage/methylation domain-containing protein [Desulfovibrio sp.]|nr:prepilin-type N-terminal cleavage/methylation domain-containing protein [Desulfovibrio sp.]MBI4958201.1 prepilin-type N-terminal cleavage/methylation domain-containing protein [Desulfovibrio sp.]
MSQDEDMISARENQRGTTLIELIVTLVILGIVAAGALPVLMNVLQGWLLAKNEAAAEENIQAALTRITHEIANADTKRLTSSWISSNVLTYYYMTDVSQTIIQLNGTNLQINNNTLVGNVVSGTGFVATQQNFGANPPTPVVIQLTVRVPTWKGNVNKTYNTNIALNTQRFQ